MDKASETIVEQIVDNVVLERDAMAHKLRLKILDKPIKPVLPTEPMLIERDVNAKIVEVLDCHGDAWRRETGIEWQLVADGDVYRPWVDTKELLQFAPLTAICATSSNGLVWTEGHGPRD